MKKKKDEVMGRKCELGKQKGNIKKFSVEAFEDMCHRRREDDRRRRAQSPNTTSAFNNKSRQGINKKPWRGASEKQRQHEDDNNGRKTW